MSKKTKPAPHTNCVKREESRLTVFQRKSIISFAMLFQCPNCKNTLNLSGTVGVFNVAFCEDGDV